MSRSVKEPTGVPRLLRIWPQEWSRVWVPGGVQFDANVSRCRKGEDISLLNAGALVLRPTPVGEVQHLECDKRAVSGKSTVASRSRKR